MDMAKQIAIYYLHSDAVDIVLHLRLREFIHLICDLFIYLIQERAEEEEKDAVNCKWMN